MNMRQEAEREHRMLDGDPIPDEPWEWIPAMLGLPVLEESPGLNLWPWLTIGLAVAITAVFLMTLGHLSAVIADLGFVPAAWGRHGGLTFITSFFLHGDPWHLISNVYFLLLFGRNVEDDLGGWQYLVLLILAAFVGALTHLLMYPESTVPCIGASGGISGVITYYALRFPRARLGFFIRWGWYGRWVQLPAYVALLCWFALQLWLVVEQHLGVSQIGATAHLGGAMTGFVAWLLWKARSSRAIEDV
jgi:membrane associated rhomboid family serine protease